ncbi:MAG: DUF6597 domain-containing transcriptional factor [Rubrobacteraceae bacterium]
MVYYAYKPGPPLSDFVKLFWFYEGYDPPHAMERILPTGTADLVINLRDGPLKVYDPWDTGRFRRFGHSLISGPHSDFFVIDTACQASTMGVHFEPGGAYPFLPVPASELCGAHVSLETLWGTTAPELRDRLLEAETPEKKFQILEQTLLEKITRPPALHPAVVFALKEFRKPPHTQKVSDVADRIGLSQRRFIQVFRNAVGLTPKVFCRIRRFQQVLRRIEAEDRVAWTDAALSCGYFDQAHFIHDFRAFSGLNPTAYHSRRGEHPNHVPLPDRE